MKGNMSNEIEKVSPQTEENNTGLTEEYLIGKGYTKDDQGNFSPKVPQGWVLNLKDYQPMLGQAIVVKVHDRIVYHGYYHDTGDFETEFGV